MNAMNFIFIPNGLDEEILEDYFAALLPRLLHPAARALGSGARPFAAQPSYIPRFLGYARAYFAGDRVAPTHERATPRDAVATAGSSPRRRPAPLPTRPPG